LNYPNLMLIDINLFEDISFLKNILVHIINCMTVKSIFIRK